MQLVKRRSVVLMKNKGKVAFVSQTILGKNYDLTKTIKNATSVFSYSAWQKKGIFHSMYVVTS
jgi:hypothetical protein